MKVWFCSPSISQILQVMRGISKFYSLRAAALYKQPVRISAHRLWHNIRFRKGLGMDQVLMVSSVMVFMACSMLMPPAMASFLAALTFWTILTFLPSSS